MQPSDLLSSLEDGNRLFTTNGTDVWELVSWCSEPTAKFRKILPERPDPDEEHEQTSGSVYSRNLSAFVPLTPKTPIEKKS